MPGQIDDIKARLDIVELVQSYIRLNKAGSNYKALCPFHSEKTPSFNVSPARQIWHCFGCGKGGSVFDFVMEIEGLEFRDALELLAKRAGIQLRHEDPHLRSERTRLYQLVEEAAKIFESVLHASKTPERITAPLAYLKKRGLKDETIKTFRLGYAPDSWDFLTSALRHKGYKTEEIEKAGLAVKSEQGSYYDRFRNRITFPISDASGRVVGFSGRIFDATQINADKTPMNADQRASAAHPRESASAAKYINTPQTPIYDKSRVLYGFDKAKEEIRRQNAVVLVEGQMDVIMSHQSGLKHAVAVSGTAVSGDTSMRSEQLRFAHLTQLKRLSHKLILALDRDPAGELATRRFRELAAGHGFELKIAALPQGIKDAADAVQKDANIWKTAVAEAKPIVQFFLEMALAKHDRTSGSGKRAIAQEVLPEIRILTSEVEKSHWLQELSREIAIPEEALWRELKKAKPAAAGVSVLREAQPEVTPGRRAQLESLLLGTLIRYPERSDILPEVPRHVFLNPRYVEMFGIIESAIRANPPAGGREHEALIAAIPEEFRDAANYLAFQAEVVLERIENATERAREIIVCLRELEREWAKDKLRALATDISAAEAAGNQEHLATLIREFHTVSAKVQ